MSYLILGIALLAGILLTGRWFASADPKTLVKVLKWLFIGIIVTVVLFFVLTGRLAWALAALPALLPWFLRIRAAARAARNFSRMAQAASGGWGGSGGGSGQTSEVETKYLRMTLDHDTGDMTGTVLRGPCKGRGLETLSEAERMALFRTCRGEDEQSALVLETYLDRVHPGWREQAGEEGEHTTAGGRPGGGMGGMSREEALEVLGLEPGASEKEIKDAHRRLIAGLHPDHGGSDYLAAKINQAKDVLLGK